MKVAVYARVLSERQDIDLPISVPLNVLSKYNSHNRPSVVKECFDEVKRGQFIDRPASSR
jgi:site-specific DNA recombinase